MLSVGGLFSGIGGWELGLERAGFRIAWHCEADEFCRRVLEHHWPGVPCYDDVRTLRGPDVEPVDVLCGGFPCQDLSLAGKGAGIDGARSGLWSEFARLIGEIRPRYVLVENVSALLGRGLGRVLGDLAALGYDAEWDCLPASSVGAPHRRDRIWIVAYPQHEPHEAERGECAAPARQGGSGRAHRGRGEGDAGRQVPIRVAREDPRDGLGDSDDARFKEQGTFGPRALAVAGGERQRSEPGAWLPEPDVGRVAYGVPARVVGPRLYALGNALVPQIPERIGRRILAYEART